MITPLSLEMKSLLNGNFWLLTNVYTPCTPEVKWEFCERLKNIEMPDEQDWLNLMRSPDNRNREEGDIDDMLLFNEAINASGLLEVRLFGKKYTWTNKQHPSLLERLDWFFTSASWLICYSNTKAFSMVLEVSDHTPCILEIASDIIKSNIFRLENYWMEH